MSKTIQTIRRSPWSFGFQRFDENDGDLGLIVLWVLDIGPWQIRKFNPRLLVGLEQAQQAIENKPVTIKPGVVHDVDNVHQVHQVKPGKE